MMQSRLGDLCFNPISSGLLIMTLAAGGALWAGCGDDDVTTDPFTNTGGTGVGGGTGNTGNTGGQDVCPGSTLCNGVCVDTNNDPQNCGSCGNPCDPGQVCSNGQCGVTCSGGLENCGGICVDTQNNPAHCGGCNSPCEPTEMCSVGVCAFECLGGTVECNDLCVDINVDPANCGGCANDPNPGDHICGVDEVCSAGACSNICGGGLTKCGNSCVDILTDEQNCGGCANDPNPGDNICGPSDNCVNGTCTPCDVNVTDCDGDGWMEGDGDCCDLPGNCGSEPEKVNPGAIEVVGNGIDDNCNGLTDLFDSEDAVSCDQGLASSSNSAVDYARALGICRQTTENPPLAQRTWGLIDAQLLHADGSALSNNDQKSLRNSFGSVAPPTLEGQRIVVLSSGYAADGSQNNPGLPGNGGAPTGSNVSQTMGNTSDMGGCTYNPPSNQCINDWFSTPNLPLKAANELPNTPNCASGAAEPNANDSVMLYLRLRAPTNAKAFSFNSYFFSAEYAEYVCTTYNDQLIALVDTPSGVPSPIPNPVDKNLMVYTDVNADKWPVGINIASGTSLFSVCEDQAANPGCWDADVGAGSCFLGAAQLQGTGFEVGNFGTCTIGGGTFWLTTSGNIIPGEIVELRIAIWDVGDSAFDSTALVDGFDWLAAATLPGTE